MILNLSYENTKPLNKKKQIALIKKSIGMIKGNGNFKEEYRTIKKEEIDLEERKFSRLK
jgi:hypothetical protein